MKVRIITAIVALAVFAGVLMAPPIVFEIALGAVILFMVYECSAAIKADGLTKVICIVSSLVLMAAMSTINGISGKTGIVGLWLVFAAATVILLLFMALVVIKHGKKEYRDILSAGFLMLYITVSMWCVQFMYAFFGRAGMLVIFICAWTCDTFAYFTGKFLGKHKLIPHVSPNKTVEGSVGGVIGAAVCCALYMFILTKIPSVETQFSHYILIGVVTGIVGGCLSQVGDLTASAVKRDADIKDFGWIFPGHGGFMDRFDSVIYIAPVILMTFIAGITLM